MHVRRGRPTTLPVVSARQSAILADKLGELLAIRMVVVLLADLDPRTLFELAVASVDTLLDHVTIQLPPCARKFASQIRPTPLRNKEHKAA